MSKKCVRLWREAHFEVKMLKKHQGFGPLLEVQMSFRVASARDCAPCRKWAKRDGFVAFSTTTTTAPHYAPIRYNYNYTFTTFHYTTLHSTTLNYTQLHYTTFHYATLHYTTPHYTTLHYTTFHYATLHYTTLHTTTLHYNYTTFHCTPLHYKLHYATLHYTTSY